MGDVSSGVVATLGGLGGAGAGGRGTPVVVVGVALSVTRTVSFLKGTADVFLKGLVFGPCNSSFSLAIRRTCYVCSCKDFSYRQYLTLV